MQIAGESRSRSGSGLKALRALNFFMADVQAGVGPFLGIFLLAHHWKPGMIGTVMTIGGLTGMLLAIPAGIVIDRTTRKRAAIAVPAACIMIALLLLLKSQDFWVVALLQVISGISGAFLGSAIIAITLGMTGQSGFNGQNGKNQAFNHAGNLVAAALSGYLGMRYGISAVFVLSVVFGALSIASVFLIPSANIDNEAARGQSAGGKESKKSIFSGCRSLLVLALALGIFHLGNAAMLPLYGMAAYENSKSDPAEFVALTIIVAQLVMIIVSIIAIRTIENKGYWFVVLISFLALPIRGIIASMFVSRIGIFPVQILDGIGAGLQSVAVPGLVAHLLNGTGRINAGQSVIMTFQGIGAALSPVVGGWIAQNAGYSSCFLLLGCFSTASLALWLSFSARLKSECNPVPAP